MNEYDPVTRYLTVYQLGGGIREIGVRGIHQGSAIRRIPCLGASSGYLMIVCKTWKRIRRPPMGLAIRLAAWSAAMKQLSTTCDFANI